MNIRHLLRAVSMATPIVAMLAATVQGAAQAQAITQTTGVLAGGIVETDADHFTSLRLRAAGLTEFTSSLEYRGVAALETRYSQSGWNRNAAGVSLLWRSQDRETLAGINAEIGAVKVAGHLRPIGDVTWSLRPAPQTGIELLAAAGLVETQSAIKQGIGYTFWGASLEQQLATRLTAIGLVASQQFTDGNHRTHVRGRLIWDVLPEQGVNLQARWRGFRSGQDGVTGAYFDPERYGQWLLMTGFRKRFSGWLATGGLGAGRETIQDIGTITHPAYLAELRAEKSIAGDALVSVQTLYTRSAGFSNSPDYWFATFGVSLIVPFK
ncbi:MAG: hypothetical protein LH481_07760 [Burkholderiales bacterium]|nr:hypothetical protein [Burkholderiales bacterium]